MEFNDFREKNRQRCMESFHSLHIWDPWDWTNAMAGECGEACNLAKKLHRIEIKDSILGQWNKQNKGELVEKLLCEVADTVVYADLLCSRMGVNLEDYIKKVFNRKSVKIGSHVSL